MRTRSRTSESSSGPSRPFFSGAFHTAPAPTPFFALSPYAAAPEVQAKEDLREREEQIQRQEASESAPEAGALGSPPPEEGAAPTVQAKLAMGAAGDRYEQETDAVAERAVKGMGAGELSGAQPAAVQAKCAACREEDELQRQAAPGHEDIRVQAKCAACREEDELQRQPAPGQEDIPVQAKCATCREEDELQRQAAPGHEESLGQTKLETAAEVAAGGSVGGGSGSYEPQGPGRAAWALEEGPLQLAPSRPPKPESRQQGVYVGPAHDRYEAEADQVAELVMAVPDAALPVQTGPAGALPPQQPAGPVLLQRNDDDVEEEVTGEMEASEADPLTAVGEGEEAVADDENAPEIQCKAEAPAASSDQGIGPSLRESRGQGSALPDDTREFMETRFGLDFGGVRVHTDSRAQRMNEAVGALAFTSGQDIYFGAGQYRPDTTLGHRLLAHELTHVVQQSGGAGPAPMGFIQRATRYENKRYYRYYNDPAFTGRVVHHQVEARLRPANPNLITEAPIPGATAHTVALNVIGSADLYSQSSNRAPDLRADYRRDRGDALTFWPLTPPRRGRAHSQTAIDWSPGARRPGRGQTADIVPRNDFPASFGVADLKPLSLRRGGGGIAQVANYQRGMGEFARQVHLASGGATHVTPRGGMLSELNLPPALDYEGHFHPERPNEPPGGLVFGGWRIWLAKRLTRGLVLYFHISTTAPNPADLRRYNDLLRRLHDITGDLRRPGTPVPNAPGFKLRPGVSAVKAPPHPGGPAATVQRDVNWRERGRQWEARRGPWGRETRSFLRGGGRGIARRQGIDRALGISRPNPSGAAGTQVSEFRRLRFWSGRIGQFVGRIRFLMGETFDRVAQRFEGFRRRFRQWHQRAQSMAGSSPGGGWRRTLIRLLLRAMQIAVSRLMSESFRIFADCANGIIRKAIRMVTDDASEIVRERVCNLRRAFEQFKDRIQEEFESRFGPIEQFVDAARTVARVGDIVLTMISLLRLGFQVVSCLAPPALGCLWGLVGQLALELVLELLVGTQWFQDNIIRHASIREWLLRAVGPEYQRLINASLEAVGLTDFAADVSECQLAVPDLGGLFQGERALEGGALTAHRNAFESRHRAEMMASLRQHFSGTGGRPATEAELRALLEEMNRRSLTPEQIREAVEGARTRGGRRISLDAVRGAMGGGSGAAGRGEPGAETTEEPPRPPPLRQGPQAPRAGGAEAPERESTGAGGIPVSRASDRRYEGTAGSAREGAYAMVREPRGGHTVGTEPLIELDAYWNGVAVERIVDVPTQVVRRTFFPERSTAETATHIDIHYRLLIGIEFRAIPGRGCLARGSVVPGRIPWRGGARR